MHFDFRGGRDNEEKTAEKEMCLSGRANGYHCRNAEVHDGPIRGFQVPNALPYGVTVSLSMAMIAPNELIKAAHFC